MPAPQDDEIEWVFLYVVYVIMVVAEAARGLRSAIHMAVLRIAWRHQPNYRILCRRILHRIISLDPLEYLSDKMSIAFFLSVPTGATRPSAYCSQARISQPESTLPILPLSCATSINKAGITEQRLTTAVNFPSETSRSGRVDNCLPPSCMQLSRNPSASKPRLDVHS